MPDAYEAAYARSLADPEGFWLDAARAIDWSRAPDRAFDGESWFPGGMLNTCHNAVDRHVAAGQGDRTALIHDSPVTGSVTRYSFVELRDAVARTAGMLRDAGVGKGDRVVIYMPMIPETVFAMLACARIGAIHSVVFGGFAPAELAKRIDDAEPRVVLTASCGIEPGRIVPYKPLLDAAIDLAAHRPAACLVLQRPQQRAALTGGRDRDWADAFAAAALVPCVVLDAADPLYILYTSGTTGAPKGVVRDNGGHAVALAWSMANIYGARPGETFWAASDVGWVVGHSYIVYAPLIHGCATVLYEGKPVGTPDAGAYWRVARDHGVDILFTAPTAIRAIRREDPEARHLSAGSGRLRALFLAGERADPETLRWSAERLGMPVIDHWWQTELGWPALATCLGLGRSEMLFGSAGHPVPGYRFAVLDDAHRPLPPGEIGELAIALPLPPGCLPTLWRNHDGFERAYLARHPGHYLAGDAATIDDNGRVHVMSRIDDIINVAGHRLSTGAMEQIVAAHPLVSECAAIGMDDALKGTVPLAVVVRRPDDVVSDADLAAQIVASVRNKLGPVAAFRLVAIVDRLPKTRSGKILRATLRDIANGREIEMPATAEDGVSIPALRDAMVRAGVAKGAP
jgi:propionyl-CoA synthetase